MATSTESAADGKIAIDAEKAPVNLAPNISSASAEANDLPLEMLKHANVNDADEAMKAFIGHEGEVIVMTPEIERRLLRKIDLNLMPVCPSQAQASFHAYIY